MNSVLVAEILDELRPEANALTFSNLVKTLVRIFSEALPTP